MSMLNPIFSKLISDFPNASIYLVGGTVRDLLLQRPQKDVDIVVCGVETQALEKWLSKHGNVERAGKVFGVFKFQPKGAKEIIDVALPRREMASTHNQGGYRDFDMTVDARIPIEEDLSRRDFTINAMALPFSISTTHILESLIDPFFGQNDLKQKTIRAVGVAHDRFAQDASRMLRAIRLACELDFEIEQKTADALYAHRGRIHAAVVETIGSELAKAFAAHAQRALTLLKESGLWLELAPEVKDATMPIHPSDTTVAFTIVCAHIPTHTALFVLKRLGLFSLAADHPARPHLDEIGWMLRMYHEGIPDIPTLTAEPHLLERFFRGERGVRFLHVLHALGNSELVSFVSTHMPEPMEELIQGSDVKDIFPNRLQGAWIQDFLDAVRDEQLRGLISSKEEAIDFLKKTQ